MAYISLVIGSFTTFAYPATFVYMLIPDIAATVYSIILAFDSSPKYKAWLPSKTMRSTIIFFAASVLIAALLPVLPGADVMADGSAMDCLWTNYMQWKIIYNDPVAFPWVTGMDKGCTIFKAADAFCWILSVGWIVQAVLYMRAARHARARTRRRGVDGRRPHIAFHGEDDRCSGEHRAGVPVRPA